MLLLPNFPSNSSLLRRQNLVPPVVTTSIPIGAVTGLLHGLPLPIAA